MKEYIFRRVPLLNRFSLLAVCCALALLFGSAAPSPPRRGHLRTGNYEYEGGVTDGKQNGYGVCRYTNGNVYYGFWNMGYKEGLGRLVFADGTMDFGVWRRGRLPKQKSKKFKAGKRVYGIDAAKYQKTINWEKLSLKADASGMLPTNGRSGKFLQPVLFALVKSTEGTTVRDPQFERNFREAKRCGVVRGAYHFLNPNTPASAQAKFFIANTPLEPGDFPPILDLEINKKTMARDHAKIVRLAKEWLRIIEKHYGVKPIIYTYENYYKDYLHGHGFDSYDFWIARYGKKPSARHWEIWQFTDKGVCSGINHAVDIDLFRGDYSDLLKYVEKRGIRKRR